MPHKYEFPVIIERDEDDVYIATCTAFKACHTQAKDIPTLLNRIKEAILLCLEVEKEVHPLKFIGMHELEVITQ